MPGVLQVCAWVSIWELSLADPLLSKPERIETFQPCSSKFPAQDST